MDSPNSLDPLLGTVVGLTDFDVTIGQCVVSDRNLACAVLIRHETLFDREVQVCLLPEQLYLLPHCRKRVLGLRLQTGMPCEYAFQKDHSSMFKIL